MAINRRSIFIAVLLAAGAVTVLFARQGASDHGMGAFKLEGAWIAKVTSFPYMPPPYRFQWSYVLAPAPSGRSASIHGSVDVGFPPNIPHDFSTPLIGEIVQTGPDTAAFNTYWYAIRKASGPPFINEIAFIGRAYGEVTFLGPDKMVVTHNFEIYLPDADGDGDGLPDPGMSPAASFTVTTSDTRIPPPLR